MILAFTLSMPGCPSWNGKWSGEGRKYVIVKTFTSKELANAVLILNERSFSYRWDDGWHACIDVHEVNSSQAAKLRKESDGFCGYDWMVDTIVKYGKPLGAHEIEKHVSSQFDKLASHLRNIG